MGLPRFARNDTLLHVVARLTESAEAISLLLSLRGALLRKGDEAISGELFKIATPRQVGAGNDKRRGACHNKKEASARLTE